MPRTYTEFMLQKEGAGAQGFIQNLLNALGSIAAPAVGPGAAWASALVFQKSIEPMGGRLYRTTILIDLTGIASVNTADDVIGLGSATAYVHQYDTDESGTCIAAFLRVFETPATGDADIDVFSATVGTYVLSDASAGLTGYAKLLDGATLARDDDLAFTALPADGAYIGLASGTGAAGTYTAGILALTFIGVK